MYLFLNQNIIFEPVHSGDIENDDARLQAIIYDVLGSLQQSTTEWPCVRSMIDCAVMILFIINYEDV